MPDSFEQAKLFFLEGSKLLEEGNLDLAEKALLRSLELFPERDSTLNNLSIVYMEKANKLADTNLDFDAIEFYKKSIDCNPNNQISWSNLGALYADKLLDLDMATVCFNKALEISDSNSDIHYNLANLLSSKNQHLLALEHFNKCLELSGDFVEGWLNKGITLNVIGRYEEAQLCFSNAIHLRPDYAKAWTNMGATLYELKRFNESLIHHNKAIQLDIHLSEAWCNKGNVLLKLKQINNAISCYKKAIELKPNNFEAWSNLGMAQSIINLQDNSIQSLQRAIEICPTYSKAWSNLGSTLSELKRYDEAIDSYDKAIQIDNKNYTTLWNKSLVKLVMGDFKDGWNLYDYRWKKNEAEKYRHPKIQELKPESILSNSSILIWYEQGLGDTIQFSRYIQLLAKLGANVTFEVQSPLLELMSSNLNAKVVAHITNETKFEYQLPLLSLPKFFKTTGANIPLSDGYLEVPKNKILEWSEKLKLNKNKLNIGIAVSGNPNHVNDKNRSIDLKNISPLLEKGNFYLIQKGIRNTDIPFLKDHLEIKYLGDEINNFTDTAAIIKNLDLIISVDTSVAHLAGALGQKTFLMLPWAPEWRWLLDRDDSPWYQSITVFRQRSQNDWSSVINKIYDLLNHS